MRLPLSGMWKRTIRDRQIDFVPVPGSFRPVGECMLEFAFDCAWADDTARVFLVTEGVMANAEFTLNGLVLGTAGPWATYRFELPAGLLRGGNVITARVRDITEAFGITPGRRYDAGLNRAIYLERRPAAFIESVAFQPVLNTECSAAEVMVRVEVNGATTDTVAVTLTERDSGRVVAELSTPAGKPLTCSVEWPRLWSPAMPNLYSLTARLGGDTVDELVGFRRIEVRGQDFFLNNARLLLKGVCRHEFTSRHGYTPTREEVYHELAMIKHTGFNYVRLVHSPHAPCVPRIAAELGLLVSEEPGTCWHDLSIPEVAAPALETLRRTVLRDRNLPSILAWYIYNECDPHIPYAVKAVETCRALHPDCLVSVADSTGNNDLIIEQSRAAGMSYYGINQYSLWPNDYVERMKLFTDKPLVFTEWGGCMLQGNERFLKWMCETFVQHAQPDASPRTAGASFWAWADYEEHSRALPAAHDGWTVEGLLDQQARPRPDLQTLSQFCFAMDHPEPVYAPEVEVLAKAPARRECWTPVFLGDVAGDQAPLEAEIATLRGRFTFKNPSFGQQLLAGIPFLCREADGIAPLLLGPGREEIVIPIARTVRGIAILGQVALHGGYPANSVFSIYHPDQEADKSLGQPASRYAFIFDDGGEEQPLQHGVHLLRGNNICRWWKTTPRAPETTPAIQTVLHPSYEILRFDLWEHAWETPRYLKEIRWRLEDMASIQALLAVSVREDE